MTRQNPAPAAPHALQAPVGYPTTPDAAHAPPRPVLPAPDLARIATLFRTDPEGAAIILRGYAGTGPVVAMLAAGAVREAEGWVRERVG